LNSIDDGGDFESHHDEPEATSVKKSEVFFTVFIIIHLFIIYWSCVFYSAVMQLEDGSLAPFLVLKDENA